MTVIAHIVRSKNIRQRELAERLGVSPAAVSQQLKHGIKSIRVARKYASILKCNPLLLLD